MWETVEFTGKLKLILWITLYFMVVLVTADLKIKKTVSPG